MIGVLLDAVAPHTQRADAVIKEDDTLTLSLAPDGHSRIWAATSACSHLRVMHEGRIGYGSGAALDAAALRDRALAAAAAGPTLELQVPVPAPLPQVATRSAQAVSAGAPALEGIARNLFERLRRSHRRVEVWAERSAGSVRVGNTRGVLTGYDVTLAGAGAVVESIGAGYAPPCRVHWSGAALPELSDLEGLVSEVEARLEPRLLSRSRLDPVMPVVLSPRALATFLLPLRAALTGRQALAGESPLRHQVGERVFDPRLTVIDDPLAPGRPGSRPVDDDGVVTRSIVLIERGRVNGFLADLETGARSGVPSTGHGWRRQGGSRVGFSNVRVTPGVETRATLLTMMGRGLLVDELEWRSGPNPLRGTFRLPAPWTYLVENGRVTGRLEGLQLVGNTFAALNRIGAIASDPTWVGSACVPSLLLEGLGVLPG